MDIDAEKLIESLLRDGLREAIKGVAGRTYENPFAKVVEEAIKCHQGDFKALLDQALASCMADAEFRAAVSTQVRAVLAKTLVHRFGGELEKQVNQLKSDPTTRARITLAIEEIVRDRSLATN